MIHIKQLNLLFTLLIALLIVGCYGPDDTPTKVTGESMKRAETYCAEYNGVSFIENVKWSVDNSTGVYRVETYCRSQIIVTFWERDK